MLLNKLLQIVNKIYDYLCSAYRHNNTLGIILGLIPFGYKELCRFVQLFFWDIFSKSMSQKMSSLQSLVPANV